VKAALNWRRRSGIILLLALRFAARSFASARSRELILDD